MAGKTKEMSKIKQLLLLKKEGVSNRKAADLLGMNKETANTYVNKAKADELAHQKADKHLCVALHRKVRIRYTLLWYCR